METKNTAAALLKLSTYEVRKVAHGARITGDKQLAALATQVLTHRMAG